MVEDPCEWLGMAPPEDDDSRAEKKQMHTATSRKHEQKNNSVCSEYKLFYPPLYILLLAIVLGLCLLLFFSPSIETPPAPVNGQRTGKEAVFMKTPELTGIILDRENGRSIAWILGEHFLVGELYDAHGQNLTAANAWRLSPADAKVASQSVASRENPPSALEQLAEAPSSKPTERFSIEETVALAPKLAGFNQFTGKHTVYGFFDPDCKQCEKAMSSAQAQEKAFMDADVQIRWLPVTILSTDRTKAGKALALGRHDVANTEFQPSSETLDKVDMNTAALIYALERPAVPYFVWQGKDTASAYIGAPSQTHWRMILNSFTNMEETTAEGEKQ